MQGSSTIQRENVTQLVQFIFRIGPATVFEAYSAFEEDVRCFETATEQLTEIDLKLAHSETYLHYVVHYPETKGYVEKQKIHLDPKKCDGHRWRFCINGWGLIQLQLNFRKATPIECRVAVNSQKRAEAWAAQYPAMKDPSLWNWQLVNKRAGQIIRRMKKFT